MRRPRIRAAGALLMVALLTVLVGARAHAHRHFRSTRSCATCVATEHAPLAAAAPVAMAPSDLAAVVLASTPSVVPVRPARSPRSGRAPPSAASVSVD